MRAGLGIVVLFIGSGLAVPAAAHIQLSSPAARYTQNNNGLETAPCGSGTASGVVTKVTPGQMLTVTWKESVSHAGHYRIGLSAKPSDFVDPTTLTIPNPLPAWDLVDGIADKTGMQTYSQSVQIPDQECPACVLQLIQVASAGTDGTNTGSVFAVYHACADLAITAGGDGGTAHDAAGDARSDLALGGRDGSPGRDGVASTDDATLGGRDVALADGAPSGGAGGTTRTGTGGGGGSVGGASGSGAGGAYGTGGATAHASGGATAGTTGSGGRGSGGAPGTGGSEQVGSGGAGGQGTGGSAASMGSGGSSATAASGGASGGNGGTGGATASTVTPSSASGCSCQTGSPEPRPVWAWLVLLAIGFGLGLRKRRRSRP